MKRRLEQNFSPKTIVSLVVILLGYFLVCMSFSNKQGFWHDEIHTLTCINGVSAYPFKGSFVYGSDEIRSVNVYKEQMRSSKTFGNYAIAMLHEGHPPLYFVY